jgi:hypothetical protein
MSQVLLFALTSALNPTLLTATMVMLLLPSPKRLLWGYLLGAYMTSITLGLVIVFALDGSGAVDSTKDKISPAADIALGLILLVVAVVLKTGYHSKRSEQRKKKKEEKEKKTPRWQEVMGKGRARDTFVVGALLTLPGASYLAGLTELSKEDLSTFATVLCVVGFNLVMLAILEIPLLGYTFAPDWTPKAMARLKDALNRNGQRILFIVALVMGLLLIVRGVVELLA